MDPDAIGDGDGVGLYTGILDFIGDRQKE